MKRLVLISCATASLLLTASASRAIDFNFYYTDAAGQGFFDPVLGDQRRAAMDAAGGIIGQLIRPTYAGESVYVRVTTTNDGASNNLGSAKPAFFYSNFATSDPRYGSDTQYAKALASHLLKADIEPDHDDIKMNINLGQNYYLGTDATPPSDQYDLVSVGIHELLHGLGFYSSFREQGGYGLFGDATYDSETGLSGLPVAYDRFTTLGIGGPPVITLSEANRKAAVTSGNLYWSGANGIAGNGGTAPKLDARNPWEDGVNVSHIDATVFPNDIISEGISLGEVKQTVSSVDRGMLRDMGWDISVSSSTVNWTPAGVNNRASTINNWSQSPYPGDALQFRNNAAGVFDVRMDLQLYQLDKIIFGVTAPAYTLRFSSFTNTNLTGFGIENDGVEAHTFILESHADEFSPVAIGSAAKMGFEGTATASNSIFEVHGGYSVPQHFPTNHYDRFNGAQIDFYDTSTAANATFNIQGAAGDSIADSYARVSFRNTSNAGSATFNNQPGLSGLALSGEIIAGFGGQTNFYNTASAAFATFNNVGQSAQYPGGSNGITNFRDNSTAGNASFHNRGATAHGYGIGVGGATQFFDHSTAGFAALENEPSSIYNGGGKTYFGDDASAGNALIDNVAGGAFSASGKTGFYVRSTAANAIINNRGVTGGLGGEAASTSFHDDSSAGSATIHNFPAPGAYNGGGSTEFYDRSTAANAHIILEPGAPGGTIVFKNNSTAGSARLDAGANNTTGTIAFRNQSTAANAVISLGPNSGHNLRTEFWDTASAGNATITANSQSVVQFDRGSTAANSNIAVHGDANVTFAGTYDGGPISSAGSAAIHVLGGSGIYAPGGAVYFETYATAASASFIVEGAGVNGAGTGLVYFGSKADAGSSTIFLKSSPVAGSRGGALQFYDMSGPLARVTTEVGSVITVGGIAGTSIGSIDGAGDISLENTKLTVGGLGQNATISGLMSGIGGRLVKTGIGALTLAAVNTYTGLTTVEQGTLIVNGSVAGDVNVKTGATLKGTALFGGIVTCEAGAICAPGNSPGTFTLSGLNLQSGSTLQFELGAVRDHIVLTDSGTVTLGGILDLSVLAGFNPALGQTFLLFEGSIGSITGTFSSVITPIVNGRALNVVYGANSVTLEVGSGGDFNGDGRVDAADYVVWRKGSGTTYTQDDYKAWRAHFGQTTTGGSGADSSFSPVSSNVPETSSLALLLMCFVAGSLIRPFRKPQ